MSCSSEVHGPFPPATGDAVVPLLTAQGGMAVRVVWGSMRA